MFHLTLPIHHKKEKHQVKNTNVIRKPSPEKENFAKAGQ